MQPILSLTPELDPRHVRLAHLALIEIAKKVKDRDGNPLDPKRLAGKRKGDHALAARKFWFFCLKDHVPINSLATITGLNRGTVGDDIADWTRYCQRNTRLGELSANVQDWVDALFVLDEEESGIDALMEEALAEIHADRAGERPQPPPPKPKFSEADNRRRIQELMDDFARRPKPTDYAKPLQVISGGRAR